MDRDKSMILFGIVQEHIATLNEKQLRKILTSTVKTMCGFRPLDFTRVFPKLKKHPAFKAAAKEDWETTIQQLQERIKYCTEQLAKFK